MLIHVLGGEDVFRSVGRYVRAFRRNFSLPAAVWSCGRKVLSDESKERDK